MTWHLSKYKQDISTPQQRHLKKFHLQKIKNPEFNTKVIVLEKNIYASTKINVFTNCRDRSVKHEKLSLLLRAGTDILFFSSNVYTLFHLYYIWAKRECKHLKKKKNIKGCPKIPRTVKKKILNHSEAVRLKFSTSKNTISDESSRICVMPEHKDSFQKEEKKRKKSKRSRKETWRRCGKIFILGFLG